jgi:hypothetical protein
METDLQAKAEKYETMTAQCEEWARQATEGPERALYEELAGYYGQAGNGLPTSHRKAERRLAASYGLRRSE